MGEARSNGGQPWFAIQGLHQLEIRAEPKNGPPVGVGSADVITGFDCDIPLVIGGPGSYERTFENGNALIMAADRCLAAGHSAQWESIPLL